MALSGVFATFIEVKLVANCVALWLVDEIFFNGLSVFLGQPRRHLLTTGWSGFVNKKKLVSGDAVLFLR